MAKKDLAQSIKNKNKHIKEEYKSDITGYERTFSNLMTSSITPLPVKELIHAPEEWNFYKELPEDKMAELIESINKHGLLHPIVVWEQSEGYMILSGHNRVKAYRVLSKKNSEFNMIPSIIKKRNEITETEAKGIIVDTNWAQRTLSPVEIQKSIRIKYEEFKNRDKDNNTSLKIRDLDKLIAEHLNSSVRSVKNYKLIEKLIDPWLKLFESEKISLRKAMKIALMDDEIQNFLYLSYLEDPTKCFKTVAKMNKKSTIDDIKAIHNKEETVEITFKVPKSQEEHIRFQIQQLLEEIEHENYN